MQQATDGEEAIWLLFKNIQTRVVMTGLWQTHKTAIRVISVNIPLLSFKCVKWTNPNPNCLIGKIIIIVKHREEIPENQKRVYQITDSTWWPSTLLFYIMFSSDSQDDSSVGYLGLHYWKATLYLPDVIMGHRQMTSALVTLRQLILWSLSRYFRVI